MEWNEDHERTENDSRRGGHLAHFDNALRHDDRDAETESDPGAGDDLIANPFACASVDVQEHAKTGTDSCNCSAHEQIRIEDSIDSDGDSDEDLDHS